MSLYNGPPRPGEPLLSSLLLSMSLRCIGSQWYCKEKPRVHCILKDLHHTLCGLKRCKQALFHFGSRLVAVAVCRCSWRAW